MTSAKLQKWHDELSHSLWPSDLPKPKLALRPGASGVTSPASAIAGALAIVQALLNHKERKRT